MKRSNPCAPRVEVAAFEMGRGRRRAARRASSPADRAGGRARSSSVPMRTRSSMRLGWLNRWRALSSTAPSTSGSPRSRAIASARPASCSGFVDAEEQPVRGEVHQQAGARRARLVAERGEGGLGDGPPSGIGSTKPTAPNCGIAVAARTSAVGVAGVAGLAARRRAASAGRADHRGGGARRRCGP